MEALIDAIGPVTKNSGAAITEARTAFDSLLRGPACKSGGTTTSSLRQKRHTSAFSPAATARTQGGGGVAPRQHSSPAATRAAPARRPAARPEPPARPIHARLETGAGTPENETTVTDVSGKTGGRIETGVTPGEEVKDTDSGSGLSWLWWVIPLVLCGGVVLWLVLGKKHEGDEDEE